MTTKFIKSAEKPKVIASKTFLHPQDVTNRLYADGGFKLPGIIETHIHGAFGWDFSFGGPEKISEMLDELLISGITGIFPTIITCPEQQRLKALKDLASVAKSRKGLPIIHGIYLEGPFISPVCRGSHRQDCLMAPDIKALEGWQNAADGLIKIVTVAPELPSGPEFIKEAVKLGITVAIGHSDADYKTTLEAINCGASHVTHIFNAMRPVHHRSPNLLSALLARKSLSVELIADCRHVAPEICNLLYSIYDSNKVVLVSDSMACTGLQNDKCSLYGEELTIADNTLRRSDGSLFGGSMLLKDCMVEMSGKAKVPWGQIGMSVWRNPIDCLGVKPPQTEVFFDSNFNWLASCHENMYYSKTA